MRKVHEQAIRLLINGKEGCPGPRDRVVCSGMAGDRLMYWFYHGNAIARSGTEGVFINWQGWFGAPSTSRRIYALCAEIGAGKPDKEEGWIQIA